jgi:hypothetical protein
VRGRPLQPGAVRSFDQIARELGWSRATVYRVYRGVFARMDGSGIPRPRTRRRRERHAGFGATMRADELAAA